MQLKTFEAHAKPLRLAELARSHIYRIHALTCLLPSISPFSPASAYPSFSLLMAWTFADELDFSAHAQSYTCPSYSDSYLHDAYLAVHAQTHTRHRIELAHPLHQGGS